MDDHENPLLITEADVDEIEMELIRAHQAAIAEGESTGKVLRFPQKDETPWLAS